jgi:hypothetical protein
MKKKMLLSALCLIFLCQIKSQTIIPLESTEMCPLTDIIFTVTLPVASGISVTNNNTNSTVVLDANSISTTSTQTTFNFTGKFADRNENQSFLVKYNGISKPFKFSKIKSFYHIGSNNINPSPGNISAPLCQVNVININFPLIQFANTYTTPTTLYGTVTTYEYLLPAGWKLGATTSDGSTWLSSSNNVTVTTDISGGNNSSIKIRAVNSCGPGLAKGNPAEIQISRPWPIFTISPAWLSATCGTSITKTFTVTTPGTISCPISYTWYLGPNNGWLYQGNPGMSTPFTVTENSITLTSSSTPTNLSNILVTPTLNGVVQPTLKSTVTFLAPNYSINGVNSICTGTSSPFTISNLVPGSTVNWTTSTLPYGAYVAQINTPNSTQTTLTKVGSGVVTLYATITNPCGQTSTVSKSNILVGGGILTVTGYYTNNYGQIANLKTNYVGANYVQPYVTFNAVVTNPELATATWSWIAGTYNYWTQYQPGGYNGNFLQMNLPQSNNVVVYRLTNYGSCGSQYFDFLFLAQSTSGYLISPNPTSNDLTVAVDEEKLSTQNGINLEEQDIRDIIILDKTGIIQSKQTFGLGTKQAKMDVSGLMPGVYIAKIFNGKQWSSMKFIKN